MQLFASLVFSVFMAIWGFLIPVIYSLPALIFSSSKIADHGAKIWAVVLMWVLKNLCGISYKVVGKNHIPNEPCIIACKHQSMWETVIMHLIINRPVYAYKKELELIPFYGWFLKVMSGIKVDRKGGAKALKSIIGQSKSYLSKGQSIVIFPQGTRVPIEAGIDRFPYQSGIVALYNSCNAKVVPVALNSGLFWSKDKLKKRGTIIIEFLEPIEPGLSKSDFTKRLIDAIEIKSSELVKNSISS